MTVSVLWLFLESLWASLQCVLVVIPDYTHLPFLIHLFKPLGYFVHTNDVIDASHITLWMHYSIITLYCD